MSRIDRRRRGRRYSFDGVDGSDRAGWWLSSRRCRIAMDGHDAPAKMGRWSRWNLQSRLRWWYRQTIVKKLLYHADDSMDDMAIFECVLRNHEWFIIAQ